MMALPDILPCHFEHYITWRGPRLAVAMSVTSREEWLNACRALLVKEKAMTGARDQLS